MTYIITSPVSISNTIPVSLNLTNTSSSQNWTLSTDGSDQLNIGCTLTPSIITLSSNGNSKLGNVINTTIDSTTNTVVADKLRSATTTISIGSATSPTVGQVLTATSSTSANWQNSSSFTDYSGDGNSLWMDINAGNDIFSGDVTHPVLTIGHANTLLAAKPTITFTNRGVLFISSGLFPSGTTFNILPNVTYNGAGINFTRTDNTGTVQFDPSAWSINNDNRAFLQGMSLRGTVNFDFTNKPQAKIYMNNVGSNNVVTLLAGNNINQGVFTDCIFFAGATQTGMNMSYMCCTFFNAGNITLNSMSGIQTILTAHESILQGGNVIINYTNTLHAAMTIDISSLDITGGQIQINVAVGSAPGSITLTLSDSCGFSPVIIGPSSAVTINCISQSSQLVCNSGLTNVSVFSAATPSLGQVLTATSSTAATWQTPTLSGTVTSISPATSSIIMSPNPITTTGTVDIGNSIWSGNKATTPVAKDGIIDVCQSTGSIYTGIATTGNSLINLGTNIFNGPAKSVIVAGGADGAGGTITINNVQNSVVSGISHNLSGGIDGSIVTGYNNVVTGGNNAFYGGQQNTGTNSYVVAALGYQASILNTTSALVAGQGNSISGGVNNSILNGQNNSITNGTRCCISGYGNVISNLANDTFLEGFNNTFSGSGSTDINFLFGFNNTLGNALDHRFNLWMGFGMLGRAATTYNSSILFGTGAPDVANAFYNGGAGISIPVGYDSNASLNLYGDRINMACNTGAEIRVFGNNIRCSTVPATGDDYTNKTYVDSTKGIVVINAVDNQVIAVPLTVKSIYINASGGSGAGGSTTATGAGGGGGGAAGCVNSSPMANTTGSFTVRVGTKGLPSSLGGGGGTGYAAGGSGFGSAGGGGGSSSITNGNHTIVFCGGGGGGGWDSSGGGGGGGSTAGGNGTGINLPGAGGNGGGSGSAGGAASGGVVYNSTIVVAGVGAGTDGTTSGFLYSGGGGGNPASNGGSIIPMTNGGNTGSGNCGGGGASAFGNGGNGGNTGAGQDGINGSGGGGADGNVTASGGNGSDGFVQVWYYQ